MIYQDGNTVWISRNWAMFFLQHMDEFTQTSKEQRRKKVMD